MRNRPPSRNKKSPSRNNRQKSIQKFIVKEPASQQLLSAAKQLFSSILFWALALISLVSFLFLIYPRISIEPGESLDPYQPFKTPFVIKNDGYWRLVDVDYNLIIDKMETTNNSMFKNVGFGGISEKIGKLGANESSTIFIKRAVSTPSGYIKYAEVY